MPIKNTSAVGDHSVAKAVANLVDSTGIVEAGGTYTSEYLVVAGMPNLSWSINQVSGGTALQYRIEKASRRFTVGGQNTLLWDNLVPSGLLSPSGTVYGTSVFATQAIRLVLISPSGAPDARVTFHLSAAA